MLPDGGAPCRVVRRQSLDLSQHEQGEIKRLLRRHRTGQALVQRPRIILACAESGATNLGVDSALKVSCQTVALWRGRFAAHRLEGLIDAPRSGAPRSIDDEAVERLVALRPASSGRMRATTGPGAGRIRPASPTCTPPTARLDDRSRISPGLQACSRSTATRPTRR